MLWRLPHDGSTMSLSQVCATCHSLLLLSRVYEQSSLARLVGSLLVASWQDARDDTILVCSRR